MNYFSILLLISSIGLVSGKKYDIFENVPGLIPPEAQPEPQPFPSWNLAQPERVPQRCDDPEFRKQLLQTFCALDAKYPPPSANLVVF